MHVNMSDREEALKGILIEAIKSVPLKIKVVDLNGDEVNYSTSWGVHPKESHLDCDDSSYPIKIIFTEGFFSPKALSHEEISRLAADFNALASKHSVEISHANGFTSGNFKLYIYSITLPFEEENYTTEWTTFTFSWRPA